MTDGRRVRPLRCGATALAALVGLAGLATSASAHPEVSPGVSLAGRFQLYTLAVPTEKEGASTAKITLTVPSGFSIDSFVPSPGWHRTVQQSSGQSAAVQRVTWSGGRIPTGEDSLFSFLARPAQPGPIRFTVQQTYSDGTIVNWNGAESSPDPAPTIDAVATLNGSGGGGGVSVLAIVAIVLAVLALMASGLALSQRGSGGRPLA